MNKEFFSDGHRVMRCGPATGHLHKSMAFCESAAMAKLIATALNSREPDEIARADLEAHRDQRAVR